MTAAVDERPRDHAVDVVEPVAAGPRCRSPTGISADRERQRAPTGVEHGVVRGRRRERSAHTDEAVGPTGRRDPAELLRARCPRARRKRTTTETTSESRRTRTQERRRPARASVVTPLEAAPTSERIPDASVIPVVEAARVERSLPDRRQGRAATMPHADDAPARRRQPPVRKQEQQGHERQRRSQAEGRREPARHAGREACPGRSSPSST